MLCCCARPQTSVLASGHSHPSIHRFTEAPCLRENVSMYQHQNVLHCNTVPVHMIVPRNKGSFATTRSPEEDTLQLATARGSPSSSLCQDTQMQRNEHLVCCEVMDIIHVVGQTRMMRIPRECDSHSRWEGTRMLPSQEHVRKILFKSVNVSIPVQRCQNYHSPFAPNIACRTDIAWG